MLVNWFGRYFCSATLHDVSQVRFPLSLPSYHPEKINSSLRQVFHSSSIILAGFSGVLVPEDPPDAYESTLDGWCSWAVAEERRRLAWFVFLSDTSNAALFRCVPLVLARRSSFGSDVESLVFPFLQPIPHGPLLLSGGPLPEFRLSVARLFRPILEDSVRRERSWTKGDELQGRPAAPRRKGSDRARAERLLSLDHAARPHLDLLDALVARPG